MNELTEAIPLLALQAEELARAMLTFAMDRRPIHRGVSLERRRRALAVAARSRALAAALALAEGDDVLTAANELTDLEEAAEAIFGAEPETMPPPASARASGTYVVERRNASTNRLLALRG